MSLEFATGRSASTTATIPPFRGLSVTLRPAPPANAGVVTVRGEVDAMSAGLLADRIAHARLWFTSVVVDLSGVTFFAAAGIDALATGGPMALVCSPAVLRVLTTCGLENRWELHRSAFLALAAGVSMDFAATAASPGPVQRAAGTHRA
jgi:anti-anti-sigma factor